MRQRKPKNLDDRLTALSHLLADEPLSRAGRWRALFSERAGGLENAEGRSLFLEIGTGKGGFLTEMARAAPDSLFLGVEGRDGVM
ncbi:MAG: hypothetical protein LBS32_05780, partial [Clostridiales Family XIII bacterium]|nr:hypothetical protein [Clostridiales Family XIII bacterium]